MGSRRACCSGYGECFAWCERGRLERECRELGDRLQHIGVLVRDTPDDARLHMWVAALPALIERLERVLAERRLDGLDAGDRGWLYESERA